MLAIYLPYMIYYYIILIVTWKIKEYVIFHNHIRSSDNNKGKKIILVYEYSIAQFT